MDEKARELFERSDKLLARSKEINQHADHAYQRLLRVRTRCTPTKELLREADELTERLQIVLHGLT